MVVAVVSGRCNSGGSDGGAEREDYGDKDSAGWTCTHGNLNCGRYRTHRSLTPTDFGFHNLRVNES